MTIWTPRLEGRSGPLYHALAEAIGEAIADGTLPPGARLPTHRDLAWTLGINIGTVTRAYALARERGLVDGEVGRGTFVRAQGGGADGAGGPSFTDLALAGPAFARLAPGGAHIADAASDLVTAASPPGSQSLDRIYHATAGGDDRLDLSLNYPYAVPQGAALEVGFRRCLDRMTLDAVARYQPPNGMRAHREAGVAWLAGLGVAVDADDLLLVPGCQSGFSIAMMALARPGETVLHEALTWPGMKAAAVPLGLKLQPVAMDALGMIPDAFEAACREHRPRLVYTMPTLHNPTAAVMPPERRETIATIARRHGVFIVEDDVYGFLLDERPPPIRSFAPDITLYITSLSKAVAAGLRVGYIAAPRPLVPRMAGAIRANLLMTSAVAGEVASELIRCGAAAEAAAVQRQQARARQQLAASELAGLTFVTHPQAFHGWLELPEPWRSETFTARVGDRGVSVTPGAAFTSGTAMAGSDRHVRVCLCAITDSDRLAMALRIVAEVARGNDAGRMPVV